MRRRFTREFAELLGRGDLAGGLEARYQQSLADTRTTLGDVTETSLSLEVLSEHDGDFLLVVVADPADRRTSARCRTTRYTSH